MKVTDEKICFQTKIRMRFRIRKLAVRISVDPYKKVTDPQHCSPPTSSYLHFYCLLSGKCISLSVSICPISAYLPFNFFYIPYVHCSSPISTFPSVPIYPSFYLYLPRNVSHLSMTRAVSAIGSILLIILAISSWHFAAKTVTQLKNLEKKSRTEKLYVLRKYSLADACRLSPCPVTVQAFRLRILCAKKMADTEDDKSMTSLENTARQDVLKILRIRQISKENLFVNVFGISQK